MKAHELEYGKEYRYPFMSASNRLVYVGQEGKKHWFCTFVKANGIERFGCRQCMTEKQIEKLTEKK